MNAINNRTVGLSLEHALDQVVHFEYSRSGLAVMWHEGTRAIPTKSGWQPVESRPDYAGLLIGSGRAVAFDAKHCADHRYRHSKERLHQLSALWEVHNAGGLAGILVVNLNRGEERGWWLRPEPEWEHEQFTSTALEPGISVVEVPAMVDKWDYYPDWLAALSNEVSR